MWPKVRSAPWPLHYKSMEKNENTSRSMCMDKDNPNILESWWFGTATMTKVRFLANSLLKGHQRSLEATNSFFLSITLDWKELESWGWLHCVCLIKTRRTICNMIYFGHYVTLIWRQILTLTWRQILTLTSQGQIIHILNRHYERNVMMPSPILYHY